MTTPLEKGNALESAVLAIERFILRRSPNVKEKSYRIESKKRIRVAGVLHEVDLIVSFELGSGYDAVYIFECKNLATAVGKNEIIVFAEKISALGAQRGFFVAKSFTADAVAQAAKEPRMELVIATEHEPANTIVPFWFHSISPMAKSVTVNFRRIGDQISEANIDLARSTATLNGVPLNLEEYVRTWVEEAINENMRTFASGELPSDTYDRVASAERTFSDIALVIDGVTMHSAQVTVTVEVLLVRPAIKSHFELRGRGRVIELESHKLREATIDRVVFVGGPDQR